MHFRVDTNATLINIFLASRSNRSIISGNLSFAYSHSAYFVSSILIISFIPLDISIVFFFNTYFHRYQMFVVCVYWLIAFFTASTLLWHIVIRCGATSSLNGYIILGYSFVYWMIMFIVAFSIMFFISTISALASITDIFTFAIGLFILLDSNLLSVYKTILSNVIYLLFYRFSLSYQVVSLLLLLLEGYSPILY